jgi:hypothetical protein
MIPMADLEMTALYASVVEDDEDGMLFIGFAEGEDEDEGYALFRQPISGGPVWFELSDEAFGAENAVEKLALVADGLEITIAKKAQAALGYVGTVKIAIGPDCESAPEAIAALREMFGPIFP